MHTPIQRLVHQIGAGAYTETPSESTQAVFVHPYAVYVYAPRQRLVHQIGAGVYTDTTSESTQATFVYPDAV